MDYRKEFNEITTGAIEKEAAARDLPPTAVQLVMYLKQNGKKFKTAYKFMEHFITKENERELDFKEDILRVKIDFKGKSLVVPMFIRKMLIKMSDRHNINPLSVRGVIALHEGIPYIFLYNDNKKVRMLKDEEIFSDEVAEAVAMEQMQEAMEDQMGGGEEE